MISTNSFGSNGGRAIGGEEDDGRNWIEIVFLRLGHLKSHYNNEFNQAPRLHLISPSQFSFDCTAEVSRDLSIYEIVMTSGHDKEDEFVFVLLD